MARKINGPWDRIDPEGGSEADLYGSSSCGDNGLETGKDDPFLEACAIHDANYIDNENKSQFEKKSRQEVDNQFYKNIDRIVKRNEFMAGRRLYSLRLRGWFYKRIVGIAGRMFW